MSKVYSNIRLFSQIICRAAACLAALFIFTAAASAATYTVDTTADNAALSACTAAANDCSLRGALAAERATLANDTINFAIPAGDSGCPGGVCTITLTGGHLIAMPTDTAGTLTITNSTGASNLRISGNNASRVIFVNTGANLTLNGVTVTNGNNSNTCCIPDGGGIYNNGTLSLTNSTVSGSTSSSQGGGIFNNSSGTATITNSTVSGNRAGVFGGGIHNNLGVLTLTNSTVSGNTEGFGGGGGIFVRGTITLTNSTVSGNASGVKGGGIYILGTLNLTSVTVAYNSADDGGGVYIHAGSTVNLGNTIVAKNTVSVSGLDLLGAISASSSFNLIGDGTGMSGITNGSGGNQIGTSTNLVDPKLNPTLALNGGTTLNHALLFTSPAIDKGSGTGTDQRGLTRPANLAAYPNAPGGNGADIGAYEIQLAPDLTIVKSHIGNFTQRETAKTYSITVTNSGDRSSVGTITVVDILPSGLTATAISGTGWSCDLATLVCTRIDVLAAGSNYSAITLTVNVANDAPSSVINQASVSGGGEANTANNAAADQTTINPAPKYAISGQVTNGSLGLFGVTVTLSGGITTTTNAAGNYSFTNLAAGGSYTVTPSLNGYTFVPPSTTFNDLGANQPNTNFAAASTTETYTVDTTADNAALSACTAAANDCSLRGAISRANATIDNDTIGFALPASSTITLTSGEIIINDAATAGTLTITNSTGASNVLISGNNASRIFSVYPGANLTLYAVTVKMGNTRGSGGGIINYGTITLTNSIVSGNTAQDNNGGGIANVSGTLTLMNSTVSGNTGQLGGGIDNSGTTTLTNSVVNGNTATVVAGGIINHSGRTLTLLNSTVSGNTAQNGGGIFNSGTLNLRSVTVAYNTSASNIAGGVLNQGGTANLRNTIVAKNSAYDGPDFYGAISSTSTFNLIGDATQMTGVTNGTNGNQVGIDPKLAPALALNGDTTLNHALLSDSPAVDKGRDTGTDQRGLTRPVNLAAYPDAPGGNGADIGAYEVQTGLLAPADFTIVKSHTGNFTQSEIGKTYTITVTNSGGTASSGLVSMSDDLPGELAPVDIGGEGWNCNFSNLTCTRNDTLAANSSYPAITLTVDVAEDAPSSVTNFAQVSGGGETDTENNQAADQTTINAAPKYLISGTIKYGITSIGQPDSFVSGVNLAATDSASASAISNSAGVYQLSNLAAGNYTVTPSKTGNRNGINAFDAVLILRCVAAGANCTLTANQKIAADADGDANVTTFDATQILRYVAANGQNANTGQVGNWKFVDSMKTYNPLSASQSNQDYTAFLIGEVDGDWVP